MMQVLLPSNYPMVIFLTQYQKQVILTKQVLLFLKNYGRFQSMANAYVTAGATDDSYGNPDDYPPQAAEFSSEGDMPFVNSDESPF